MIDTHCHIYLPDFNTELEDLMHRVAAAGVARCYLPAIDRRYAAAMQQLVLKYPQRCFAMTGLHPCSVNEQYGEELDFIREQLKNKNVIAIGETGLDFYWDKTFIKQQYEALQIQAELALEFNLPLILHTRNATQETIDVMRNFSGRGLRGIFHCFGNGIREAEQIIDLGFMLGIGGVITYKNSGLAPVIAEIDLAHVVLETDAPYLSPAPFRGKRNEPAYLKYVAEKIAEVKNCSVEEVDRITTANAEKIFG